MIFHEQYETIRLARSTGRGSKLWLESIKAFFVALMLVLISDGLVSFINDELLHGSVQEPYLSLLYLYEQIICIGLTILYCTKGERRTLHSMGLIKPDWKAYGKGAFLGLASFSVVVLLGVLFGGFHYLGIDTDTNPLILLLFLFGYIVQGFSEELVFRGYALVSISRKNSILSAAIISSLYFSFLHIFNDGIGILPIINLFLFGMIAAICFLKTDNIWCAAALHSIWNYAQGNLYGFSVSGTELTDSLTLFEQTQNDLLSGGLFGPEGSIIVTVVFIGIIACLCLPHNGKRANVENPKK